MPTVTKTFAFAADAEGLADAGSQASVAFNWVSGDGNPAGCVQFLTTAKNLTGAVEFARRASTGQTWETWGVPTGSTVTQVQITAWNEKLNAKTKLTSHTLKARVIGSGGSTVHSAGDLLNLSLDTTVDTSWQTGAAGTAQAVDSGSQASTTDVRLELEYSVTTSGGGGTANEDWRLDQIVLTITYSSTTPVSKTAVSIYEGRASRSTTAATNYVGAASRTATTVTPYVAAKSILQSLSELFEAVAGRLVSQAKQDEWLKPISRKSSD